MKRRNNQNIHHHNNYHYRVLTYAYFVVGLHQFALTLDTIDILCLVYSNFLKKKIQQSVNVRFQNLNAILIGLKFDYLYWVWNIFKHKLRHSKKMHMAPQFHCYWSLPTLCYHFRYNFTATCVSKLIHNLLIPVIELFLGSIPVFQFYTINLKLLLRLPSLLYHYHNLFLPLPALHRLLHSLPILTLILSLVIITTIITLKGNFHTQP